MSWVYLISAILLEVAGTTALKVSHGMSRLLPTILVFGFYGLSFAVFSRALKAMDIGIGYAIWSGLGTAAITLIGFFVFKEPLTPVKLFSLAMIIAGVVGLNLGGAH